MLIEKQKKKFGKKLNKFFSFFEQFSFYRMYQHEQEQLLQIKTEEINRELEIFLSFMRSNTKTSPILQTPNSYINENRFDFIG
jgi:hypothetical protein